MQHFQGFCSVTQRQKPCVRRGVEPRSHTGAYNERVGSRVTVDGVQINDLIAPPLGDLLAHVVDLEIGNGYDSPSRPVNKQRGVARACTVLTHVSLYASTTASFAMPKTKIIVPSPPSKHLEHDTDGHAV